MAYQQIPNRTSSDANAAADINQGQDNIDAILGSTWATSGPQTNLFQLNNAVTTFDSAPTSSTASAIESLYQFKKTFQGDYASGGSDPWLIKATVTADESLGSIAGTWYPITGAAITVTPGTWKLWYEVTIERNTQPTAAHHFWVTLSTTTSTETDKNLTCVHRRATTSSNVQATKVTFNRTLLPVTIATNTTYSLLAMVSNAVTGSHTAKSADAYTKVYAERLY